MDVQPVGLTLDKIRPEDSEWIIAIELMCDGRRSIWPLFNWIGYDNAEEINRIFATYGGYVKDDFYCIKDQEQGLKFIEEIESRRTMAKLTKK